MTIILDLTEAQYRQLIVSLKNDWMDNDKSSQAIINRILSKIGNNIK